MQMQRFTLGDSEWNRIMKYKAVSAKNLAYSREHDGFPPPRSRIERFRDATIGDPFGDLKKADPCVRLLKNCRTPTINKNSEIFEKNIKI